MICYVRRTNHDERRFIMELSNQIKKYRGMMNLSQEALAEKVYVSRQTISNWETGKNYPDIHSLLLLSNVFNASLDELIKGDVEIMKNKISSEEIRKFNSLSVIYAVLFIACLVSPIPLAKFLGWLGFAIYIVLLSVTLYYAVKIEKLKKANDIQTYKEIVAFTNGENLDDISKYREEGKRPYQKVLLAVGAGVLAFAVCVVMNFICGLF